MNMITPPAALAPDTAITVVLRDYQDRLVDKVRVALRSHMAVLMVAGTGSGKTVMFSYISKNAANRGKRILILAHRDTLIKQASRKLRDYGVQHGIIMAGFTPNPHRRVQVASVQTIVRRLAAMAKRGDYFDIIVVDEAHLSAANSYMKVFAAFPKARILGVTGSPIRLDGKGLGRNAGCVYDTIVQDVTLKELIEDAYGEDPDAVRKGLAGKGPTLLARAAGEYSGQINKVERL
ncbi:hypothetical protein CHELA1G11_10871 [Hyphomicrobiales bacterium]|nr:hypothetical protein CHELA1G11_10871 [Hyphomicrobiales bacterium]CAH1671726.1 hypothetical protein CHELA1G2_13437 [Hyphomicrobiales bacterium]